MLPLRASDDLGDIADGLSEEIVDRLSVTRALRVRPLASVRASNHADDDPRELGAALGVDVVVAGSIRRVGDVLRIAARAIGVADGLQLWANRVDTKPEGLLAAGDDVARAVAHALTVEIDMPARIAVADPRVAKLYLEGKARVRRGWPEGTMENAIATLEAARRLAPDDAPVLAAIAMAHARSAFFNTGGSLSRARTFAERAVAIAPAIGEPWPALGIATLYGSSVADSAFALSRAVARAPGLGTAHSLLGALLLEAGAVDEALVHLDAAIAIERSPNALWDAARAHMYRGRDAKAFALLAEIPITDAMCRVNIEKTIARFHMWRGERYDASLQDPIPPYFRDYIAVAFEAHRNGTLDAVGAHVMQQMSDVPNPRLRAARSQFAAELLAFVGDHNAALALVERSVDAGLQDHLWMERCPALAPLRTQPRFRELAVIVARRADSVLASVAKSTQ